MVIPALLLTVATAFAQTPPPAEEPRTAPDSGGGAIKQSIGKFMTTVATADSSFDDGSGFDPEPEDDGLKRWIVKLAGPGDFPKRLPRYARRIMLDFLMRGHKDGVEYGVSVSTARYRDKGQLLYEYRLFYKNTHDPKHSVNIPLQFRQNDMLSFHTHPIRDPGVPSYCPDQKNPTWGDLSVSMNADRDGMHVYVVGSEFVTGYADGKVGAVYLLKTGKKVGTNIRWKEFGPETGCVLTPKRGEISYVIE